MAELGLWLAEGPSWPNWVGLVWAGLLWAELGWAGLDRAGLDRAGLGTRVRACPRVAGCVCAFVFWVLPGSAGRVSAPSELLLGCVPAKCP